MPRVEWAVEQVEKEQRWLPVLAQHLPLTVPTLIAKGRPDETYPWPWSIYRWINGRTATIENVGTSIANAISLTEFVQALQKVDATNAPTHSRGEPLATRDAKTRECLLQIRDLIDYGAALEVWEDALSAEPWSRPSVWFHGDLHHGNLLVNHQRAQPRLSAVIDFGLMGAGDPACDLMSAWGLFSGEARSAFHKTLAVDESTWRRGRGFALSQAAIYVPYYLKTQPKGVQNALRVIRQVTAEYASKFAH